jgi:putative N6-adenine-specific DNA methylase
LETFDYIATTIFGFEEILQEELQDIGAENTELLTRAVKFSGDRAMLYKSNLLLRTAVKVLVPLTSFEAENEQQLYDGIKALDWEAYFGVDDTFAIDGSTHSEIFTHSHYVALKTKDAIADYFREKHDKRPSVDILHPDVRINIHIYNTTVMVSLDSSGVPLGKRNYRLAQTEAPMSEILAAGIILMSGWDRKSDFLDPMCGSGTFSIEAAMMAANIPAGMNRSFGFETWNDFDLEIWKSVVADAEAGIHRAECKIFASDIDRKAVSISASNAKQAGVDEMIRFEQADFFDTYHTVENSVVVLNPPYGERMEMEKIVEFYTAIGTRLKHFYQGCNAWIISSNYEALKHFGLRPSRKIKLFNGPLECRLHKYELYQGSKRTHKYQQDSNPED